MTDETITKQQIKYYLNLRPKVFWFSLLQGLGSYKGLPDIMIFCGGKAYACEIKGKKGKQSDNQIKFQEDFERTGNKYILAKSVEDVANIIK